MPECKAVSKWRTSAHEAARNGPPVRRISLFTHETWDQEARGVADPTYRDWGQADGYALEWGLGQIGMAVVCKLNRQS